MAEVDTSIYRNAPNPLSTLSNVYGIMNAAQTNQLLQQSQQIRQYELQKDQTNGLINAMGSISSVPGATKESILARGLEYSRAAGVHPDVFNTIAGPLIRGDVDAKGFGDTIQAQQQGTGGYAPVPGPPVQGPGGELQPSATPQAQFLRNTRNSGGAQPVGVSPAETSAQTLETGGGVSAKLEDQKASGDWQSRKLTQSKIIQILHKGGDTLQGIGTSDITNVRNFLSSVGVVPASNSTVMVEQLKKYYQRNIETNSNATTDYGRAGAVIGNPNIDLTTASAKELAKMDTIQSRLRQAQTLELQDTPSRAYPNKKTTWNQNQDLYAYGMDMLGPKEQHDHIVSLFPASSGVAKMGDTQLRTFLKGVQPGQYKQWDKFRNSLDTAHKYQQLDLPTVGQ